MSVTPRKMLPPSVSARADTCRSLNSVLTGCASEDDHGGGNVYRDTGPWEPCVSVQLLSILQRELKLGHCVVDTVDISQNAHIFTVVLWVSLRSVIGTRH